ncbi:MAG TPA: hypothetical protein PKN50_07790 [Spirochaetota bacterium]|nr:hypothetical protein [Spirochaetota bacterium]HPV42611.1 hypothetical protein [Spirochaetota bacterium]
MNKKKLLISTTIIGITAILVVVIRLAFAPAEDPVKPGKADRGMSLPGFFGLTSIFREDMDLKQVIADDPEIEMILGIMKERYGKKLSDKRIQIRLVGGLIRHLKRKNPYDWKERIRAVIAAEFTEYSAELMEKIDKLDEFNNYLKEHRGDLQAMSPTDRKEAMMSKRREIFGPEYEEIWDREITAGKISDMLGRLDGRSDLSPYDKMRAYSAFTKSLYPESSDLSSGKSEDEIMVRNYELVNNFLEMDSVQSDLRNMAPDERARFLKSLRQSMGMKDDVIRKMEDVDATMDRMWENAPAYNRERSEISANYKGTERERKLDEARKKYFGANAGIIKMEEDTLNVNRFQFPRRWGRY